MNEEQLFHRIHTVVGPASKVLLARFWLQMDDRPTLPSFTFHDVRHLDAEGRSVFHSIVSSYSRQQFAPLAISLVSRLRQLTRARRYRDAAKPWLVVPVRYVFRPARYLPTLATPAQPGETP